MSSTTEQIKERLSVEEVVGSYLKIQKAGKNFKALCPFHNEKTPSFVISPERESFYCFGCNRGGDIFTFVEEFEGLDFMGALKVLAERAGVPLDLQTQEKGTQEARERLYSALEDATLFFEKQLAEQKSACAYLKERGVSDESSAQFRLGFAANEWRALLTHMTAKGYTEKELRAVGLVKQSQGGKIYDTFRGRILFPITDTAGRVVAFSGRLFEGESDAKYLNSPETAFFKKSHVLYGYDKAKRALRTNDFAILVEGNLDVVLAHQAGFRNTVAPLGTAFTEWHVRLLQRMTNNIVLAFDADAAGVASATKSAEILLASGFDVKVAGLPDEKDPADIIVEDGDEWKRAIRESEHIVTFLLGKVVAQTDDERKRLLVVGRDVLPFVSRIPNAMDQAHFVKQIAEIVGVSERSIADEIAKIKQEPLPSHAVTQTVQKEGSTRHDEVARKLTGFLLWVQEGQSEVDTALIERVRKALAPHRGAEGAEEDSLRFEAEATFAGSETLDKQVSEMLVFLEEEVLKRAFAQTMQELKQAEAEGKTGRAAALYKKCTDISRDIQALRNS